MPNRKKKHSGEKTSGGKRSASRRVAPAGQAKKPGDRVRSEIRPPKGGTAPSVSVVGIGASAGGLEAFTQFLKHLPLDTGMGFVLVQHLDPDHESALTQILSRVTALPVHEIVNRQRVEANHVYVIPRDKNLSLVQGVLRLAPRARTRTPHRPIDVFFESLAQDQRERAIGIVLSGTASDGTLGLEAIKAEGGITFAQDDTAKYDSMPRHAIAAGCVDLILAPANMAKELMRIAKHPYSTGQPFELAPLLTGEEDRTVAITHQDDDQPRQARDEATHRSNGYKQILLLLRNQYGVDFSLYKPGTIKRRIARRIVITQQATLEDYARFLQGHAQELDALYFDALINVTSFFRNPETFDALQRKVLPKILAQRGDDPVRCWVVGCSTGQEAYSLAISFMEVMEKMPHMRKLQVFATDLNEKLLEKGRYGLYTKALVQDISPERLRRFFREEEGGYRINKSLREMVVFARQNLITDPPFSRMDLISCRNLLIYLAPDAQQKIFPLFHYALKPHGLLVLGNSESVGGFTDLFEPMNRKGKIFSKRTATTQAFHMPVGEKRKERTRPRWVPPRSKRLLRLGKGVELPDGSRSELNAQREADRIAVSQFAPPGVLIDDALQVLQFRGPTGAYLAPPAGKASFDVLKMAREGLMLPLRAAINKAKQGNKTVRTEHVRVKSDGETRTIHVKVIPLKNLRERCFLVVFEEANESGRVAALVPPRRQPAAPSLSTRQESRRIVELEADLSEAREYLQSVQEQQEASTEELQAASEEVQSSNEELQSMNEELETSKEELESSNEELTTVNEEMSNRNVELHRLNDDLVNLQTSIKVAIVLLGRDLTIRRLSPHAEKLFNLLAADVGRPISRVRHPFVLADPAESPLDLETLSAEVIRELREQEREVRDESGRWYSLRIRPYMTLDNKVDGTVLVLMDIDAIKRSEQAAAAARDYAENVIATLHRPLLVLDDQLRVESGSQAFYRSFRVAPEETVGKFIYDLGNHQWDIPRLRKLLGEIQLQGTSIEAFQVEHDFVQLGHRTMLLNARRIEDPEHKTKRILLTIEDITERKQAEAWRARLAAIVESSDDAIVGKDLDGIITSWNQAAERLFGYTTLEAVGRSISILIPPDRLDEETRILEQVRRGESTDQFETVRRHKDGRLVDVSIGVSPIKDTQGRVIGASKIARDITERLRAEEVQARLAAIVESSEDAIMSNDLDGVITSWNQGAERLFGYTDQEAVGQLGSILVPPDRRDEESRIFERMRRQETIEHYDSVIRRKDGALLEVSLAKSPIVDATGQAIGASTIARDITEHKEAQARLLQSGEEMARAVKTQTAALVHSHERLRALTTDLNLTEQRERKRLAAELHDHLAQLLVLAKLKLGQSKRVIDLPEKRDALIAETDEVLSDALTYTRTLVADLSPPVLYEFGLPAAFKWLAGGMRQHALAVTVHSETQVPKLPDDQAVLLFQSVRELLMNAAKHAESATAIVRLECRSGELRIEVQDRGVGFQPAALTAADTSQSQKFGLFSIRERMKALGGLFEVNSAPGQGTTAILKLPLTNAQIQGMEQAAREDEEAASSNPIASSPLPSASARLIRVLLADDHTMIREGLRSVLEAHPDVTVVGEAADGEEAVAAAEALQPSLIVMDINMPKLNGIEATAQITSRYPHIIVIGLSVNAGEANEKAMKDAGAAMLLTKEAAVDELYQAIHTAVNDERGSGKKAL